MSSSVSLEYLNAINNRPALCAQNTSGSEYNIITGGVNVELEDIPYINLFDVNEDGTEFTVQQSGIYYVSFGLFTTAALGLTVSVRKNNVNIENLIRTAAINVSSFVCDAVIPLAANDVLSLRIDGILGIATLSGGVGAYLNAYKIN